MTQAYVLPSKATMRRQNVFARTRLSHDDVITISSQRQLKLLVSLFRNDWVAQPEMARFFLEWHPKF
jgi:hypothetical protein